MEFGYDHLGNRNTVYLNKGVMAQETLEYSHNLVNQYSGYESSFLGGAVSSTYSFAYDDNGNLSVDENGNTYFYDYRNRLIEVQDPNSDTIAEYSFDALGRRISKTVDGTTTYFIFDPQGRVIAEYEGSTPTLTREFIYGNGFNEVLAMFTPYHAGDPNDWDDFVELVDAWLCVDPNDACYNGTYDHNNDDIVNFEDFDYFAGIWDIPSNQESNWYYLHDALGSVRGIVGGRFNREEDREFYNYDVYGKLSVQNAEPSKSGNPNLFAGYRYDAETALYHTPHRAYDPEMGRWLQFDPIGYADGMNLYEYVVNNPVRYIDPLGLTGYEDIAQRNLEYSCNCGWIDWGHAQRGMGKHIDNIKKEGGTRSHTRDGFKNETEMEHGKWFLKESVLKENFIRSGLTESQQESVALAILNELAWAFETMQSKWYYKPFTKSGFSEEDLPSDLIGFYQKIRTYSDDDIKKICQTLSVEESQRVWHETGGLKNYKPSWKDNHWEPKYHQADSKTAKLACEKKNSPCQWPSELKEVEPAKKGELWDDWKYGWKDEDEYPDVNLVP